MLTPSSLVFALALAVGLAACDDDACHLNRALLVRAQQRLSARDYIAAVRDLEAAYRADPRPSLLLRIGVALDRAGDHARAAEAYERYLAVDAPDKELVRAHTKNLGHMGAATEETAEDDALLARIAAKAQRVTDDCP